MLGYTEREIKDMAQAVAVAIDTLNLAEGEEKVGAYLRATLDLLEGIIEEGRA